MNRLLQIPSCAALILLVLPFVGGSSFAQSTIHADVRFAWAANLGFVNFRPSAPDGVVVGEYFCSGFAFSANCGWINLGDGEPDDGIRYSNSSGSDFGVNHDGEGRLSGLAWGANIGWVNFGWASEGNGDQGEPTINLESGEFSGFAWGANVGWINLGSGLLATAHMTIRDADGDQIADAWEIENFGDLATADAGTDNDADGDTDRDEYLWGADPSDPRSNKRSGLKVGLDGDVVVSFRSDRGRRYQIETSTDLVTWIDSGLGEFVAASSPTIRRLPVSGGRMWFRVRALLPLSS